MKTPLQHTRWTLPAIALGLCLGLAGCRGQQAPEDAQSDQTTAPHVTDASWGPVEMSLSFSPVPVALDRDVRLEIRVTAPAEMDIEIPDLADRLEGFATSGRFERDPVAQNGKSTRVIHMRLTPLIAERYRLAPFPVRYADRSVSPPLEGWFPTPPVLLETKALPDVAEGDELEIAFEPEWVRPTARSVVISLGFVILGIGLLILIWKLLSRVREEVALRRMSPRERAMRELERLMAQDLIGQHKVKAFYLELTMIVRRYIERRHAVRAPEQTTEEFLAAVSKDTRFEPDVVGTLKDFLEAADMVKFAAHKPSQDAIDGATQTARTYIEVDDASQREEES